MTFGNASRVLSMQKKIIQTDILNGNKSYLQFTREELGCTYQAPLTWISQIQLVFCQIYNQEKSADKK